VSWQNWALSTYLKWRMKPLSKHGLDVAKVRAQTDTPLTEARVPAGWCIRETTDLPLKGEWVEPVTGIRDPQKSSTILYLHGGGYFFCSPKTHRPITIGLASRSGAHVFALDYRLAPEHRFPAAIDDAVAAYRRLLADGTPASRIVLGGDSAGGGLALATLLSLRDAGDPLPAGAILFSPWTDLAGTGASVVTNDKSDVMFFGSGLRTSGNVYLGDTPATNPLASPLYADLKGLPPLFIQASSTEVLLDDSTRLAEKAGKAGVRVSFKAWRGLPHVWQIFTPMLPEARAALTEASAFIKQLIPSA
jgi:monoterpene epsilon-lactone hydrolase